MHGGGAGAGADGFADRRALVAVRRVDSYFDQLVRGQRPIHLRQQRRCDTGVTDADDGLEGMGAGFEASAFARCQINGHVLILAALARAVF